jgi:hypothetical protein
MKDALSDLGDALEAMEYKPKNPAEELAKKANEAKADLDLANDRLKDGLY